MVDIRDGGGVVGHVVVTFAAGEITDDELKECVGSAGVRRLGSAASPFCAISDPLIHPMPESLRGSAPLFLTRRCDRTLGSAPRLPGGLPGAPCRGVAGGQVRRGA
jgi:hypothetical protein